MTFDEWIAAQNAETVVISSIEDLRRAWDAGVSAERERCAEEISMLRKLVQSYEKQVHRSMNELDFGATQNCAAAKPSAPMTGWAAPAEQEGRI